MKTITTTILTLLIVSFGAYAQPGANLLASKLFTGLDEDHVDKVEFIADGNTVDVIPDGTEEVKIRCYVAESATNKKKVRKQLNQDQYKYSFALSVKSATYSEVDSGRTFVDEQGKLDSWKEVYEGDGYLEFSMTADDIMRYCGDINQAGQVVLEANLITPTLRGAALISRSTVTVDFEGEGGPYEKMSVEGMIEGYKSGGYAPKITDANMVARVTEYARNEHDREVVHIAIRAQSIDALKNERWLDVIVTLKGDGEEGCSALGVSLWESTLDNTLMNYRPQVGWDVPCKIIEEIRNVR